MRCTKCSRTEDKVIDSRESKDGTTIRRRRECLSCGHRFTTYEQLERTDLRVVKRNDVREPFSRDKLLGGLVKACEKRPVSMDRWNWRRRRSSRSCSRTMCGRFRRG